MSLFGYACRSCKALNPLSTTVLADEGAVIAITKAEVVANHLTNVFYHDEEAPSTTVACTGCARIVGYTTVTFNGARSLPCLVRSKTVCVELPPDEGKVEDPKAHDDDVRVAREPAQGDDVAPSVEKKGANIPLHVAVDHLLQQIERGRARRKQLEKEKEQLHMELARAQGVGVVQHHALNGVYAEASALSAALRLSEHKAAKKNETIREMLRVGKQYGSNTAALNARLTAAEVEVVVLKEEKERYEEKIRQMSADHARKLSALCDRLDTTSARSTSMLRRVPHFELRPAVEEPVMDRCNF